MSDKVESCVLCGAIKEQAISPVCVFVDGVHQPTAMEWFGKPHVWGWFPKPGTFLGRGICDMLGYERREAK